MDAAKTLVVVEDNEIMREGIGTILRREGYEVVLTASGQEALEYLLDTPHPDLILLDMLMDDGDGWSVLNGLRKIRALAGVPVLIVTGLSIATDEWAASLGACGLLRKPFDSPDLLAAVRHCCGK